MLLDLLSSSPMISVARAPQPVGQILESYFHWIRVQQESLLAILEVVDALSLHYFVVELFLETSRKLVGHYMKYQEPSECAAMMTSGTVDLTASAPRVLNARISAGVK